jgi:hypothetical protein
MKTALIIAAVFVFVSLSLADIIHVPADTSTIQGGIYLASEGDTVLVAEDTYFENINFRGKAITVASQFIMDGDTSHISNTIIDGSQPSHPDSGSVVFFISGEDSSSILEGFTIKGGTGTEFWTTVGLGGQDVRWEFGGGILVDSSGGTIKNNIITDNIIDQKDDEYGYGSGAGIYSWVVLENQTLIIENNRILHNTLDAKLNSPGGGIGLWADDFGEVIIRKNVIMNNEVFVSGNWKAQGGGIWCEFPLPTKGKVQISENIISRNRVECTSSFGGGIGIAYWEPGGEFQDYNPNPIIYNNIISDNYSSDKGAGIEIFTVESGHSPESIIYRQPVIINNTIVNNKSADGCGIFCYDSYPFLMNNILWNDLSEPGSREIFLDDLGIGGWSSNNGDINIYNSILNDPNLGNLNDGVFYLEPIFSDEYFNLSENSPAVGLGRKCIFIEGATYQAPDYDLTGNIRPNPIDTLIDIGAFESAYAANPFVYPKSFTIPDNITYLEPTSDYLGFTAEIQNPDHHNINVFGRIVSVDEVVRDSVELIDDGNHNDGAAGDLVFGGQLNPINIENTFKLSLGIKDSDKEIYTVYNDNKRITTIGKIIIADSAISSMFSGMYTIKISLRSEGETATAENVSIEVSTTDTLNVNSIIIRNKDQVIDIEPYQTVEAKQSFTVYTKNPHTTIPLDVKIYSNGYHFWSDDFSIPTALEGENQKIPATFLLSQNYPNPFNPSTTIEFSLPKSEFVELKIYNILGKEVATIVSNKLNQGNHIYQFEGKNLASGIYYYQLVAGDFREVKKMILLR